MFLFCGLNFPSQSSLTSYRHLAEPVPGIFQNLKIGPAQHFRKNFVGFLFKVHIGESLRIYYIACVIGICNRNFKVGAVVIVRDLRVDSAVFNRV